MRDYPMASVSLKSLRPAWTEFTATKGVLRILKPGDDLKRANGMVFRCPHCSHDKELDHYCIFLFAFPGVPDRARPTPRFLPKLRHDTDEPIPVGFEEQSLMMIGGVQEGQWLQPGDLICKWQGTVQDGVVHYAPKRKRSFIERFWN